MLKKGNKNLKVYKGAYKSLNIQKNGKRVAGFKNAPLRGVSFEQYGTYNELAKELIVCGVPERDGGKNLCPRPISKAKTYDDGHYYKISLNSDGTINFLGTKCSGDYEAEVTLPAGTYAVSSSKSGTTNGHTYGFKISNYSDLGAASDELPQIISLNVTSTIKIGLWVTAPDGEISEITLSNLYLQIEQGDTVTEYEPSKGNIYEEPSLTNYRPLKQADGWMKISGKNALGAIMVSGDNYEQIGPDGTVIFPEIAWKTTVTNFVTVKGIARKYSDSVYELLSSLNNWLTDRKTYTLSANSSDIVNVEMTLNCFDKTTGELAAAYKDKESFTVDKQKYSYGPLYLSVPLDVQVDAEIRPQIEVGERATVFQRCRKIISHLPQLNSIEVSSNYDYNYSETDENGETHYYITDTFENGRVLRRVGVKIFDGSETITVPTSEVKGFTPFRYIGITDGVYPFACSHFKYQNSNYTMAKEECITIFVVNLNGQVFFAVSEENIALNDVAAFKAWLAEQYNLGTPVTVYYVLSSPYYEYFVTENDIRTLPLYTCFELNAKEGCSNYRLFGTVRVTEDEIKEVTV